MIISASRRTDIPAFYGDWFINRVHEGYVYTVNPFNTKQVKGYSLKPEDVDVIVFWTKNPKPFIKHLDILDEKSFNYYFQYTLNSYPTIFEPNLPLLEERLNSFKLLSERIGAEKVIWRYDPIVLSSITNSDFHLASIENIARELSGYTKRLIISYLDFYGKVKNRISMLEQNNKIKILDVNEERYKDTVFRISRSIKEIAEKYDLEVFTCGEAIDLDECGIKHGSCIDGNLIKELFKIDKQFYKDKNQRKECLCSESVDIGVYNTCKFKCTYCYANFNEKMIENNVNKHILKSASMVDEFHVDIEIFKEKSQRKSEIKQLSLFDK